MHVQGQNLDAFRQIAFGTYSLGNVVLHGEAGLDKVNHHRTGWGQFFSASHQNDPEENQRVRTKLLEAIVGDGKLAVKELDVIARRLGISRDGRVVDAQLAGTALKRREIQKIFTFMDEARFRAEGFAELRASVHGSIDAAEIDPLQRTALETNLLGRNGQLDRLYQTSLDLLAGNFLGKQQIKNTGRESVALASSAVASLVANAIDSAAAIKAKSDEASAAARNAAQVRLDEIEARFTALSANEAETGRYRQIKAKLQQHLDSIRKWMDNFLLAYLSQASAQELNRRGAALDSAIRDFVRSRLAPLESLADDQFAQLENQVEATARRIADDAEAAKVDECCEAISSMFAKAGEQLQPLQEEMLRLAEFEPQLDTHARLDERRDGDLLAEGVKELRQLVAHAFTEKTKLGEEFAASRKGFKSAEAELLKARYQRSLDAVVKNVRSQFAEVRDRLAGRLQLTVLPQSADDVEAARGQTMEKRKALTAKLETEWRQAEQNVKEYADNLLKLFPNRYPDLSRVTKRSVEAKFREIVGRFSVDRQESFVARHAVDIMPEKMSKKACEDMLKIVDNLESHEKYVLYTALECQLRFIGQCLDGSTNPFDLIDFLVGRWMDKPAVELVAKNPAKMQFLKRNFVHFLQRLQPVLVEKVQGFMTDVLKFSAIQQYLNLQLQKIAQRLQDPQELSRVEEGERLFERMCKPARDWFAKHVANPDERAKSALEDFCALIRGEVDSSFIRHGQPAEDFTADFGKKLMERFQLKRLLRPGSKDSEEELAKLREQLSPKKFTAEGLELPKIQPVGEIDAGVDDQLYLPGEEVPGAGTLPRLDQSLQEGVAK